MTDIHAKNLNAINTVLKFDGDIILGPNGGNQCDKMGSDALGNEMWFISLNEPAGDCEAYVVTDKAGKVSYYDYTHDTVVIKDIIMGAHVYSEWKHKLDALVSQHQLESGRADAAAIVAYNTLLSEVL